MGSAYQPLNDIERAAVATYDRVVAKRIDKRIDSLMRGVPTARVVKLPGASHYVFLTRQTEVLAEMYRFVGALK